MGKEKSGLRLKNNFVRGTGLSSPLQQQDIFQQKNQSFFLLRQIKQSLSYDDDNIHKSRKLSSVKQSWPKLHIRHTTLNTKNKDIF
jgi:ribosome biogenesis protein Tsr3